MTKAKGTLAHLDFNGVGESFHLRTHNEPVDMVDVVAALDGHVRVETRVGSAVKM